MKEFPTMHADSFKDISKESITGFAFSKEDVHTDERAKSVRLYNLKRAELLGNIYKNKVKIMFMVANGEVKRVYTTVWASTSDYIAIKSGVSIPIKSILNIEF